jgi:hypothetical protein
VYTYCQAVNHVFSRTFDLSAFVAHQSPRHGHGAFETGCLNRLLGAPHGEETGSGLRFPPVSSPRQKSGQFKNYKGGQFQKSATGDNIDLIHAIDV